MKSVSALPFELFVALRHLSPKRTFVSVITVLSLLGVVLGVMVLIVVISVMSGFERDLREKVLGFTAHVTVTSHGIMEDPAGVLRVIESNPEVLGASPFVTGPVLIEYAKRISTPFVRGVMPGRDEKVMGLRRYLDQGEFLVEGEGVVVGARYAAKQGIEVGDKLLVFSPRNVEEFRKASESGQRAVYLPTELVVTGTFSTGMYDYDANFILASLETAQRLYNLDGGVHGIAVRVREPLQAERVKKALNPLLEPPVRAWTWMDLNRQLFSAIAVERNVMFFLLLFIIVVAAFGLASTLITVTVQKARDIGVLKALGASEGQILRIFLAHGFVVGVLGSGSGLLAGLGLLRARNEAAQLLARVFGIEIFPYEIYQFAAIPAQVNERNLVVICVSAVVICVLAALFPAWRAASLPPARALRSE